MKSRNSLEARNALVDLISAHEMYKSSSEDVGKAFHNLKNRFNLPQYKWEYLSGYLDAARENWMRNKLVFCYIGADGKPFKNGWNEMTEEQREFCRQNNNSISGFFWLNKDGTIGKPYFVTGESKKDENGNYIINDLTSSFIPAKAI